MHTLRGTAEAFGERTRLELDASEVTVNRFDHHAQQWVTVANIGHHGLGEERFPTTEVYSRGRFPTVTDLLERGEGYLGVLYVEDCLPEVARLLALFGKSSCVGAPLTDGQGRLWGELYATRDYGRPPFTRDDLAHALRLAAEGGPLLAGVPAAPATASGPSAVGHVDES